MSPYDDGWLLGMLSAEIALNDPRTVSLVEPLSTIRLPDGRVIVPLSTIRLPDGRVIVLGDWKLTPPDSIQVESKR